MWNTSIISLLCGIIFNHLVNLEDEKEGKIYWPISSRISFRMAKCSLISSKLKTSPPATFFIFKRLSVSLYMNLLCQWWKALINLLGWWYCKKCSKPFFNRYFRLFGKNYMIGELVYLSELTFIFSHLISLTFLSWGKWLLNKLITLESE